MPLTGKYLKYSPEITLEIFTMVWNKLLNNGWRCHDYDELLESYQSFSGIRYPFLVQDQDDKLFCTYDDTGNSTETTVQEILGYDPFVKDFVLPEKWYVPVTDETAKNINIFKSKTRWYEDAIGYKAVGYEGVGYNSLPNDYIEITFEQFKKYVLKESIETPKEGIPEYVELLEGFDNTCTGKIFDTNQPIPQMSGWSNQWTWESIFKNNIQRPYFKPSTREAYDAQNNPKSIKKWSVGSYVVFLKDGIQSNGYKKGAVEIIRCREINSIVFTNGCGNTIEAEKISKEIKWFTTKSEAEEFAKTLVEPVKEVIQLTTFPIEGYCKTDNIELRRYLIKRPNTILSEEPKWIEGKSIGVGWNERSHWIISEKSSKPEYQLNQLEKFFNKKEDKQPLKQAVHCKTQEEWDFVTEKLGYKWAQHCSFSAFSESTCISLIDTQYSYVDYLKNDYQILSFQEWCDLNGYKMEKEVKFEVGKWYKNLSINSQNNTFGKFLDLRNNDKDFWVSEYIYKGKFTNAQGWLDYSSETVEINIKEIQQYLPDGHPDKIKVDREFKFGDWVIITSWYFDKSIELNQIAQIKDINLSNSTPYKLELSIPRENYSVNTWYFKLGEFRHATPEEIQNYKDREAFNSYNLADIKLGKTLSSKINSCQAIERLDRSNKMILSIDDEELPMVSIIKTNSIKQLLNNN